MLILALSTMMMQESLLPIALVLSADYFSSLPNVLAEHKRYSNVTIQRSNKLKLVNNNQVEKIDKNKSSNKCIVEVSKKLFKVIKITRKEIISVKRCFAPTKEYNLQNNFRKKFTRDKIK